MEISFFTIELSLVSDITENSRLSIYKLFPKPETDSNITFTLWLPDHELISILKQLVPNPELHQSSSSCGINVLAFNGEVANDSVPSSAISKTFDQLSAQSFET